MGAALNEGRGGGGGGVYYILHIDKEFMSGNCVNAVKALKHALLGHSPPPIAGNRRL